MDSDLTNCLDRIWQSQGPRLEEAQRCLPPAPLLLSEAAAFDLASYIGLTPRRISVIQDTEITIEAERLVFNFRLRPTSTQSVISYTDIGIGVEAAVTVPRVLPPKQQEFAQLLCGLQIARDHIDSILYLPLQMREQRLSGFSKESGMTLEQFRNLAMNYMDIKRSIVHQP